MENIEQKKETPEVQTDTNNKTFNGRKKCAVIGFILTVLAWCTMAWYDWIAVVLVVAAIVVSAFGCRLPRGGHRNLAITSIVAASALLLAIITIWVGLAIFV